MARGILDEYDGRQWPDETVTVRVMVEHKTARAVQVSQAGQTPVWIPLARVVRVDPEPWGPGDWVDMEIPERDAEERCLE